MNTVPDSLEFQSYNPYIGPEPFEKEHRDRFYGRKHETNEIFSLIIAHRALLLYSQSGAGKTSLLNAGLIPRLQEEGFKVLPIARVRSLFPVKGLLPDGIQLEEVTNIYVFYTLLSWERNAFNNPIELRQLTTQSLADYLLQKLPHVIDNEVPTPWIIIFDQFEELFSFYPECWMHRENFFKQISEILQHAKLPPLRIIFSMRDDYLARMDSYTYLLPGQLQIRFYLELLREDRALDAILKPLELSNISLSQRVARKLVDMLRTETRVDEAGNPIKIIGEFIEPLVLQIACKYLWEKYKFNIGEISEEEKSFIEGSVKQALTIYYKDVINHAATQSEKSIKDISNWIENKFIPSGRREGVYFTDVQAMNINVVRTIDERHLIRKQEFGDHKWYELTHDAWVEIIQDFNKQWKEDYTIPLRDALKKWKYFGKYKYDLVDLLLDQGLTDALNWANDNLGKLDKSLRDFVSDCNKAHQIIREELAFSKSTQLADKSKTLQNTNRRCSLLLAIEAFNIGKNSKRHVPATDSALREVLPILLSRTLATEGRRLNSYGSSVNTIAISKQWLVIGSQDGVAHLWKLDYGGLTSYLMCNFTK